MGAGIAGRRIAETPVAIIDFETTGLVAGADRVVEVSVVRSNPGETSRLVLDSLVNPRQPVTGTEIHGITDSDVRHAPTFQDIAGELLAAVDGCVVAAYNVYFDMKFLNFEMANAGVDHEPPHFCLMYLRPLLGLGKRCRLDAACQEHGINYSTAHVAANDALVCGTLFSLYMDSMQTQGIDTYGDLMSVKSYKFFESFINDPYTPPAHYRLGRCERIKSRFGSSPSVRSTTAVVDPVRQYWESLKVVLADLTISDEELAFILAERQRLNLAKEQIRVMHAKAFASAIAHFGQDQWLDDSEVRKLKRLHDCLAALGWAPGQ